MAAEAAGCLLQLSQSCLWSLSWYLQMFNVGYNAANTDFQLWMKL